MCSRRWNDDTGSAALEFMTVGLLLTVPLVYLIIALAQLQAGALAVEGAARNAARTVALHGADAAAMTTTATELALADAGIADAEHSTVIDCGGDCATPGGTVTVSVEALIPLPLMPPFLGLDEALAVPVTATAVQPVSLHVVTEGP